MRASFFSLQAFESHRRAAEEAARHRREPGGAPTPVPPSASMIDYPADQYMHRGAPTEWWWHIGTLRSGKRTFGFEINAASFVGQGNLAFTQVMLTDVDKGAHYQRTTPFLPPFCFNADTWAEHDPTTDWHVGLGSPTGYLSTIDVLDAGSGYTSDPTVVISGGGGMLGYAVAVRSGDKIASIVVVSPGVGYTSAPAVTIEGGGGSGAKAQAVHSYVSMDATWANRGKQMEVKAHLVDVTTRTEIDFDLTLAQRGLPFIVWGTGQNPVPGTTGGHLQTNNYYYSLTRLQASGRITMAGESFPVTGTTWMDHEYGAFTNAGKPVQWILQDAQLDNGVTLSNYAVFDDGNPPRLNQPRDSNVTVQRADGTLYFVPSVVTPIGRTWKSPVTNQTYFMEFLVEIPAFAAKLHVNSLVDSQEFPIPESPVYEGVAHAAGTFEGKEVHGDAWNEQTLGPAAST